MRINERLSRLEANTPSAPSAAEVGLMIAIDAELGAYHAAKASLAIVYAASDTGPFPIRRSRAAYHHDPDGPSLLADWGRLSGFRLPALQVDAVEMPDANN